MKRALLSFIILLFALQLISAININVEKVSSDEVMIADSGKPVTIDLRITNMGEADNFMFYTFFGSGMYPKGTVLIKGGETEEIKIGIYPRESFKQKGFVTFNYFIKSTKDNSEKIESLTIKIIELKDAFEIGSEEFYPGENSIDLYIKNRVNFDFGKIHIKLSSPFFEFEKDLELSPYEKEEFNVQVNREDFRKLTAGFYTVGAYIEAAGKEVYTEGTIKFPDKDLLNTEDRTSGFVITTRTITNANDGNTIANSNTIVKKNIISRLFTGFSIEPDSAERSGLAVYYGWFREIKPGESFEVVVKTNWLFPLLVVFFIGAIVLFAVQISKTNLVMRKKVSFVRAKGGEFALKVSVFVNAKKYIERVTITDRIPYMVKLHERFGVEQPKRFSEKERKIEWEFEKLEAGEVRVLSYIIYSKVGVLGRFALPPATAVYDREGEIHESQSNRAFFLAEQRKIE